MLCRKCLKREAVTIEGLCRKCAWDRKMKHKGQSILEGIGKMCS